MCNRALLLFGKLPQWNLHVNCHVNRTTFQSGLRFQTGLSSLRVSCKRALRVLLLFGKLQQWNLHVNCHVNGTTFQSGLIFQTGLSSLRVSCKRALRSTWPKWNLHRSEFHYARSHVNANNKVTLRRSEISNRFEFAWGIM